MYSPPNKITLWLICSCVLLLLAIFLLQWANDAGIDRRYALGFLTSLWSIVIFTTFFLLPPYKVTQTAKRNQQCETTPTYSHRESRDQSNRKSDSSIDDKFKPVVSTQIPLRNVMCSTLYFAYCFWFIILNLSVQTYIAFFNPWVSDIVKGDENTGKNRGCTFTHINM